MKDLYIPNEYPTHSHGIVLSHSFLHLFCITVEITGRYSLDNPIEHNDQETRSFLVRSESFRLARDIVRPFVDSWKQEKQTRSKRSWFISDVLTERYLDIPDHSGVLRVIETDHTSFTEDKNT